MRMFLNETGLKKITEDKLRALEDPVTEEEVLNILKNTPTGKNTGPDGLMTLYYRKFKEILIPKLFSYMNGMRTKWEIRKEASITTIPKEGKDVTLCSSCRPISLLNADMKPFAKVLAGWMKTVMNDLVHANQVGFITG